VNVLTPLVAPQATINGPLTLPPIATPNSPALSSVAGGSIGATTYYVRVTIVSSSGGQTLGSAEVSLAVAASRLLVIASPTNPGTANALGWYPYVGTTAGGETLQTTGIIPFGTAWTIPTTGLVAGSALPVLNQTAGTASVGALSCLGFTFGLIAGVNSSLTFPGSQMTFYAGASPVALITSAGAVTAASYAAGSSIYGGTSASIAGALTITGTATKPGGGSWTATSDDLVKKDVRPHTDGLAQILALRPIVYRYNGRGGTIADGREHVGLSAQAARSVIPRAVTSSLVRLDPEDPEETDLLALDSSELLYTVLNAVRELSAEIEALKARRSEPAVPA
jgi:hypothetical protein